MKTGILSVFTFFIFLLFPSLSLAQPEWVKELITRQDQMTPHADASVLVLHDIGEMDISQDDKAKIYLQTAYKILNSEGEKYGSLNLHTSSHLKLKSLKGWIYTRDNEFHDLEKENIFEFGGQENSAYYDDSHAVVASLPYVEPGVIVAFEAELEEKGWTAYSQNFVFQRENPVLLTRFTVTIPEGWHLGTSCQFGDEIEFRHTGNRYSWTGQNLPYQKKEPLSPSWNYLSRKITVTCYNPDKKGPTQFELWKDVAAWVSGTYAEPAIPTEKIAAVSAEVCQDKTSPDEKIEAIADFIQKQIRYVAIEIGKERWEPRPAEKILLNRYGDCKDMTTLMRAMLQSQDISSLPVLINTDYQIDANLPNPFQFDHCIIALPIEKDSKFSQFRNSRIKDWLIFDPTDPIVHIGDLPHHLQGRRVLLGMDNDSALYRLPYPAPTDHRKLISLQGEIFDENFFTARVRILTYGGLASQEKYNTHTTSNHVRIDQLKKSLVPMSPYLKITDYRVEEYNDSLVTTFEVTGHDLFTRSGQYIIFHPNIFQEPESPELTEEKRIQPIWFGGSREAVTSIVWKVPETWKPTAKDFTLNSSCDGASLSLTTSFTPGYYGYKSVLRRTGILMNPGEYQTAREFSRDMSIYKSHAILFTL